MKYMLKYTHPAVPKDKRIVVNDAYDLEFLKTIYTIELIKVLFTPIGFTWEEMDVKSEGKDKSVVLEQKVNVEVEKSNSDKVNKTQYNNYSFINKK